MLGNVSGALAGAFDQWQEAKSLLTGRDGRRMQKGGQLGGGSECEG